MKDEDEGFALMENEEYLDQLRQGVDVGNPENKTILVVEDEVFIRENLIELLEIEGFKAVGVENGQEAIESFHKISPNLILLDVRMPIMDGYEAFIELRKKSNVPIFFLTANADRSNLQKIRAMYKLGCDGYFFKPFDVDKFIQRIGNYIHKNNFEIEIERLKRYVSILEEDNNILNKENANLNEKIQEIKQRKNFYRYFPTIISSLIKHVSEKIIPSDRYFVSERNTSKNTSINAQKKEEKKVKENEDHYKAICAATAHSLRGEFMHIGSATKSILEVASNSPDIQEECELIDRSLEYGQILLRQLLDHLDIGKPSIELVDVLELISKTELLARPRLPSSIELKVIVSFSVQNPKALANFEQLMSILLELIKNSTKALSKRGGTIELRGECKNNEIAISVKDNGSGISEEVKDKLLKETVPSKSGLGLGLFLSGKLIHELGGRLDLHSTSEEGTEVTILLPIANK